MHRASRNAIGLWIPQLLNFASDNDNSISLSDVLSVRSGRATRDTMTLEDERFRASFVARYHVGSLHIYLVTPCLHTSITWNSGRYYLPNRRRSLIRGRDPYSRARPASQPVSRTSRASRSESISERRKIVKSRLDFDRSFTTARSLFLPRSYRYRSLNESSAKCVRVTSIMLDVTIYRRCIKSLGNSHRGERDGNSATVRKKHLQRQRPARYRIIGTCRSDLDC